MVGVARSIRGRPWRLASVVVVWGLLSLGGRVEALGAEPAATADSHEGSALWSLAARLLNFGILAGGLGYLLRRPFAAYLARRGAAIRRELAEAEALSQQATAQLAEIEAKLRALPGAIEALRARAAEEIAAEEARIQAAAEAERERLLAHARREIDLQVRIARESLIREAAELAVAVAAERVKRSLTPEVHRRLIDRYAEQVARLRTLSE